MTAVMACLLSLLSVKAADTSVAGKAQLPTSVAGFFQLPGSGRMVVNFNEGWRFLLGDEAGASAKDFDDTGWQVVSAPHTLRQAAAAIIRVWRGTASIS